MIVILRILGILSIISGLALGITQAQAIATLQQQLQSGEWALLLPKPQPAFLDMLPWFIGGAVSSVLWFALAQILAQQATASHEREEIYRLLKRSSIGRPT